MPDLADAILLAVTFYPGEHTASDLVAEYAFDLAQVEQAVEELRARGHLQKKRGNSAWGDVDRLRPSKAGQEACRVTLRAEILSASDHG